MGRGYWTWTLLLTSQMLLPLVMGTSIELMPPVAATEGETFNLTCKVELTDPMEGVRLDRLETGGGETKIYVLMPPDHKDDPNLDKTKYSVSRMDQASFTITVKAATFEDAGRYLCVAVVDRSVRQSTAVVVVRQPTIQIRKNLPAGQDTPVVCDSEYEIPFDFNEETDGDRLPKISARIADAEQTGTMTRVNKRVMMNWNMTVSENDDKKELICRAFTTVPDYSIERAQTLSVVYETKTVTLSPVKEEYTVGDKINCTADGNPDPEIKWEPVKTNTIGVNVGTALSIVNQMVGFTEEWKCSAYNMISAKPSPVVEKSIIFTVVAPYEPPTGEKKEPPTAAIAAGVTVPLVIIIGVVIALVVVLLRRRSKAAKPPSPPQGIEESQQPYTDNALPPKDIPPPTDSPPKDGGQSEKPIPAQRSVKPNSQGHNVGFSGKPATNDTEYDIDMQAEVARRAMTPMPGDDRGYSPPPYSENDQSYAPPVGGYQLPSAQAIRQAPQRELRRVQPPTQYPDMAAAHPGLQQAFNKPKPAARLNPDTAV